MTHLLTVCASQIIVSCFASSFCFRVALDCNAMISPWSSLTWAMFLTYSSWTRVEYPLFSDRRGSVGNRLDLTISYKFYWDPWETSESAPSYVFWWDLIQCHARICRSYRLQSDHSPSIHLGRCSIFHNIWLWSALTVCTRQALLLVARCEVNFPQYFPLVSALSEYDTVKWNVSSIVFKIYMPLWSSNFFLSTWIFKRIKCHWKFIITT